MDDSAVDQQPTSTLHSTRLDIRFIERERKRLSFIQFPFYSGMKTIFIRCLYLGYFEKIHM